MRIKKYFLKGIFCIGILVMLLSVPSYAGETRGVTDDTVRIGCISALTGPGAFIGVKMSNMNKAVFQHFNDNGGIHGRKVKFHLQDNAYDPIKTVTAAKYLLSRYNIFAMSFVFGSTALSAIFPLIDEEGIPTFSDGNLGSLMHDPPKKYIFSSMTSADNQFAIGVDYLKTKLKVKNPKIAILYQDDEYGKDGLKGLKKAADFYNIEIKAEERYKRGAIDINSQLFNIRRAKADYVFLIGLTPVSAMAMVEAKKMNWKPQFILDAIATGPKIMELAGDAAEGSLYISITALWDEETPGVFGMRELAHKYLPKLKNKDLDFAIISTYTCGMLLVEGLKRSGRDLSIEGYVKTMESLKDFDTGGLIPPVTFGPNNREGVDGGRVVKIDLKNKNFIPLTGWMKPSVK